MIDNYSCNIDKNNASKGLIIKNGEMNNLKTARASIAVYAFVGATLLSIPTCNYIDYSRYAKHSMTICSDRICGQDKSNVDITIDLLKTNNINKINKIKNFSDDWNGNGASRFSDDSIDMFIMVIDSLIKQPQIVPTGNNSLLMQYEKDNNSLLVFDVSLKKVEMAYIPHGDFEQAETDVYIDDICNKMNQRVETFYES